MSKPVKADDWEDWEEEEAVEALDLGGVQSADGSSDVAVAILSLIGDLARLQVLLRECEAAEFRALRGRLDYLHQLVALLPKQPRERRPMGFAPPEKGPRGRKRVDTTSRRK